MDPAGGTAAVARFDGTRRIGSRHGVREAPKVLLANDGSG